MVLDSPGLITKGLSLRADPSSSGVPGEGAVAPFLLNPPIPISMDPCSLKAEVDTRGCKGVHVAQTAACGSSVTFLSIKHGGFPDLGISLPGMD